ncbi:lysozyme g-like isoform X2 [Bufo bufo]|uniref:lysozyme g-like isoform X2 n=1 Tax=Bufo bufo TaxID=8384 RepID=UPI001ABE3710|nr:lysozyme g-like isoform X2 [Bufo bufo]
MQDVNLKDIVVTSGIYGDIGKVPTSGASRRTAQQDRLTLTGVQASKKLAENDLGKMNQYHKSKIQSVAQKTGMDGAVIAGIISRESRAGSALKNGLGDHNNGFGLMQVDKRYHKPEGTWNSEAHMNQATKILISSYNTMMKNYPSASKETWLKGAIAAYNTGTGRVKNLNSVDLYTTGRDYANDVAARAQFFRAHGY